MQKWQHRLKSTFIRVVAILSGTIITTVLLFTGSGTYSNFTSSTDKDVYVKAASTEDIIQDIHVEEINPIYICLTKADKVEINPVIYFSIEGEAAEYLLHINPVVLDTLEKRIPIETNINLAQYMKLIFRTSPIEGTIKIKYLNEYIDETKEIKLTSRYLRSRFIEDIKRKDVLSLDNRLNQDKKLNDCDIKDELSFNDGEYEKKINNKGSINSDLTEIIAYTAKYGTWNEINIYNPSNYNRAKETKNKNNTVPKSEFSEEQKTIIDIIAPGLRQYLNALISHTQELINQNYILDKELSEKEKAIKDKDMEIEKLKKEIDKYKSIPVPTPTLETPSNNDIDPNVVPIGDNKEEEKVN